VERPETRYVAVGDADVAYQIVGDGSPDFLYCYGLGSHVDLAWDVPGVAEIWRRMATFCRPIIIDRRGTGASDRVLRHAMPTWEEWVEDLGAVLDAVESTQAVVCAELDAGPFAILFAATHPERVAALVLSNTAARYVRAGDYPIRVAPGAIDALVEVVSKSWDTPELAVLGNPSASNDDGDERARLIARVARASATPRAAAAQYDYILRNLEIREVLSLIRIPTLVLHSRGNVLVPIELSRYLADHIAGASFVELEEADLAAGWAREGVEVIAEFLTGERHPVQIDRILTTILFTDICGSTQHAASLGDARWRSTLDAHDRTVRDQIGRFRGREIKTTGDGFLVSFDGPARAIRCARSITEAPGYSALRFAPVFTPASAMSGGKTLADWPSILPLGSGRRLDQGKCSSPEQSRTSSSALTWSSMNGANMS
jgi:pimeloyl-ACP methyl ester carboxylesterase